MYCSLGGKKRKDINIVVVNIQGSQLECYLVGKNNYILFVGPDGELIMNPIPGEAGTDYPVYNSVPDTGFSCNQQDYPGIFTDVASDCQVEY